MGLSSQQYDLFSFNDYDELPLGWAISSVSDNRWEHGKLPTNKIYGPDVWNSGEHGMGISLAGKYANEMYTHLISPEYSIPDFSSARLSFSSWVCMSQIGTVEQSQSRLTMDLIGGIYHRR